ncbi:penicillin-binding protein activator LpoB [Leptospira gomenensis]|uniref:Penicillin-binding protein activator LpoB n=1 Tax=Leptospira gomenensis TaxID=2484974 RepID=A0A5F1YAM5_9LEPT|nr:CsgG/HfaB family protein [Leptospira gomenensis]TGK33820.1 penicillin-binding protein activator LpoB [Leptospira gomenensis]TGK42987.1 penicillin-binding protein activator LpoB [Leptospira gomenensis]TGK44950.1 penicillin-binding protein activator LpoB [Leptospira gomenensis]TGK59906.1 penicillin-binding protein activator LpoB [Leptospira gomenensis]
MKYKNFIIFFTIIFLGLPVCTRQNRSVKRNAPQPLAAALSEISQSLKKQIQTSKNDRFPARKSPLKLAVLPLLNESGNVTSLGAGISRQLIPVLNEPDRIVLVEKSQLDRLIDEQSFQKTGLVLSEESLEIGKLSGADLLLLGTVQFDDQFFRLQIRVVSLQSGEILAVSESVFDSDDTLYNQSREIQKR